VLNPVQIPAGNMHEIATEEGNGAGSRHEEDSGAAISPNIDSGAANGSASGNGAETASRHGTSDPDTVRAASVSSPPTTPHLHHDDHRALPVMATTNDEPPRILQPDLMQAAGGVSMGSSMAQDGAAETDGARHKTRLQSGIGKPKLTDGTVRYGCFTSTGEPQSLAEAIDDKN
jgi:hypothetical protein